MMLGPMKKKMITVGVVAFVLPCVIFGAIFGVYSSKKKAEIEALNAKVADSKRYGFATDLPINHVVTEQDLLLVDIKEVSAPFNSFTEGMTNLADPATGSNKLVDSIEFLVGKKLKIPVSEKTIAIDSMFFDDKDEVKVDVRSKEYNSIVLPSDLGVGDVVDIRITYPTGEDFIVLVAKEIKKMGSSADSNTVFFDMTEEEMHQLGSALIESYISSSIKVYAVKYVNPNQQLVDEFPVNYVEKYEVALNELISGDQEAENARAEADRKPKLDASGDPIVDPVTGEPELEDANPKTITVADITVERIAAHAGMDLEFTKLVKNAIDNKDENLTRKYSNMVITVPTELVSNYPVKKEVTMLLAKNPNVIDIIQQKYNAKINSLEAERATLLDASVYEYEVDYNGNIKYKVDPETGLLVEDSAAIGGVASGIANEINIQKTERQAYIQGLLQQSVMEKFN